MRTSRIYRLWADRTSFLPCKLWQKVDLAFDVKLWPNSCKWHDTHRGIQTFKTELYFLNSIQDMERKHLFQFSFISCDFPGTKVKRNATSLVTARSPNSWSWHRYESPFPKLLDTIVDATQFVLHHRETFFRPPLGRRSMRASTEPVTTRLELKCRRTWPRPSMTDSSTTSRTCGVTFTNTDTT